MKFTDLEKATIADALAVRGNILNKELAAIENYFKQNNEATFEYTLECLETIGELITIAEVQTKLLRSLPRCPHTQKEIKTARANLKTYQKAFERLSEPLAGVYTVPDEQD